MVSKPEGEGLEGIWVFGPDDSPDAELRLKGGKLSWLIQYPKRGSTVRIEAEHGVTRDGVLYGIIMRVDYGAADVRQLPDEDDTFSFRFRVDDRVLIIKDLRGKGFDDLKKVAQGRYKRKD
jgi:hypothetical protein